MKRKTAIIVAGMLMMFLTFSGLVAAEEKERMWPVAVDELVAKTMQSVKTVDMTAFKKVVDSKEYDLIIDVREADEISQTGYVPGAISIPRGFIEFKIWKKIGFPDKTDTKKKIYLYCKLGGRAALSAKSLQDLGFTNVIAVNMTVAHWMEAGYPLVKQ